jgi:hypothetical protein
MEEWRNHPVEFQWAGSILAYTIAVVSLHSTGGDDLIRGNIAPPPGVWRQILGWKSIRLWPGSFFGARSKSSDGTADDGQISKNCVYEMKAA